MLNLYKYFKGNVGNRIQYQNAIEGSFNNSLNLYHYFKESPETRLLFFNSLTNDRISFTPYPQQPPITTSLNGKSLKKSS